MKHSAALVVTASVVFEMIISSSLLRRSSSLIRVMADRSDGRVITTRSYCSHYADVSRFDYSAQTSRRITRSFSRKKSYTDDKSDYIDAEIVDDGENKRGKIDNRKGMDSGSKLLSIAKTTAKAAYDKVAQLFGAADRPSEVERRQDDLWGKDLDRLIPQATLSGGIMRSAIKLMSTMLSDAFAAQGNNVNLVQSKALSLLESDSVSRGLLGTPIRQELPHQVSSSSVSVNGMTKRSVFVQYRVVGPSNSGLVDVRATITEDNRVVIAPGDMTLRTSSGTTHRVSSDRNKVIDVEAL